MIICKECRCFNPVTVSDRYCGECCIGDTRKHPFCLHIWRKCGEDFETPPIILV